MADLAVLPRNNVTVPGFSIAVDFIVEGSRLCGLRKGKASRPRHAPDRDQKDAEGRRGTALAASVETFRLKESGITYIDGGQKPHHPTSRVLGRSPWATLTGSAESFGSEMGEVVDRSIAYRLKCLDREYGSHHQMALFARGISR